MKLYVENRTSLHVLTMGLNRYAKHREWVNAELTKALKKVREIRRYHRSGRASEQNSWDCGLQDAFGDMVDQAYQEYTSLKIAYKLQRQDATLLSKIFNNIIGN